MTDKTQPEALRLAEQYDYGDPVAHSNMWKAAVCNALRRQHARIVELEARLEAIGAGGVSGPLMDRTPLAASAGSEPVAWQSIETAPKDGTRILLHPAVEVHDAWSKGYWSEQHKCWIVGGSASGVTHTHWMPLPPPPTTSAGSGKGE